MTRQRRSARPGRAQPAQAERPGRFYRTPLMVMALFALITLVPLAVLAVSAVLLGRNAVSARVRAEVRSAATLEERAVSIRIGGNLALVAAHAGSRAVADALGGPAPDGPALQQAVQDILAASPGFSNAAVVSPSGRLLAAAPPTPAIIGRDFSYRDWFQGVSRTGKPYVAAAVRSATAGHPLVVALAAPIHVAGPATGPPRLAGYLVQGYPLSAIQGFVAGFEQVEQLGLTVTDQRGVIVAAPHLRPGLVPAASDPRVRRALAGQAGILARTTAEGRVLSAYAPVPGTGWAVLAEVPQSRALADADRLALTVGAIAAGLAAALAAATVVLGYAWHKRAAAEAEGSRAVSAADETARRLAAIVDSSTDAIIGATLDGVITSWNAGATVMYGYTREEMTGRSAAVLIPPERPGELADILRRASRGEPIHLDTQRRRKDGRLIDVWLSVSPVKDANGTVIGVATLSRDATERNRIGEALRRSEDMLNRAQRVAHVGGWEYDAASQRITWTDETYHIHGVSPGCYDPNSLEGNIAFYSPEDQRLIEDAFDAALTTGKPYDLELRFTTAQGAKRWVRTAGEAEMRDDQVLRVYGHIMDITDLRTTRDQLAQLNADLETRIAQRTADLTQANQDLEAFTYSVSHDLRIPLSVMRGFAEALDDGYRDQLDETGRDYLDRIQAAAGRMGTQIEDLLQLSRATRAGMRAQRVNLSEEAARITSELAQRDPQRRARFTIQPAVQVTADPSLIRTVLDNLLGNAWKFTATRPETRIEFGAEHAGGELCCWVRDNGVGFDAVHADKIFQPFERLYPETRFPGTGIGLASVRRVIQRHRGRAWAESSPGQGATFYFTLPDHKAPASDP